MSIQKYNNNNNDDDNYNYNELNQNNNIDMINQQLHNLQLSYGNARIVIREQHIKISRSITSAHNNNYNQDTQQNKSNNYNKNKSNNYNKNNNNNYNKNNNNNYNKNKNNNYNKTKNNNYNQNKNNNYNQNKNRDVDVNDYKNDYKNNNKLVEKQYEKQYNTVCILFKKPNEGQNCYCFYTSNNNNQIIQIDKYLYNDYKNEIDYFIRNLKRNIKENKFKLFDNLWGDIDTQFKNEIHNVITRYDRNISNSKMIANINYLNELISRYSN
jgi:hypothetical protein